MAEEKKMFAGGGMNMDAEERVMKANDYRYALNCRVTSPDEENEGAVENVRGNLQVSNLELEDGTSLSQNRFQVIGSYEDKKLNILYYFVCDTTGNKDCIVSNYTEPTPAVPVPSPGVFKVIYEDISLNFSIDYLITGINMIFTEESALGGILYWTDDLNPPRKINVRKAYNFYINNTPLPDPVICYQEVPDLSAIVPPPMAHPNIGQFTYTDANGNVMPTSGNNTSLATNDIKNTLWQFKYRYIYRDNYKSSWSPISESGMTSFNDGSIEDLTVSNYLEITLDTGVQEVKAIELAVRENEDKGDFYLISKIEKNGSLQKNISLSSTGGVMTTASVSASLAYNTTNNTPIYYIFTNNEPRIPLNLPESNKLFDDVPLLSKSQEIIDGNRIAYGNVVNGYDPVETDTEFEVVYQPTLVSSVNTLPITYTMYAQVYTHTETQAVGCKDWRRGFKGEIRIKVGDPSTFAQGTLINISLLDIGIASSMFRSSSAWMGCSCPVRGASRIGRVSLTGVYTVNSSLTSIADLAAQMGATCNVNWRNEGNSNFTGDNIAFGRGHGATGTLGYPTHPFSTYNGTSTTWWGTLGNDTIVFKYIAVHGANDINKSGCNSLIVRLAAGFDGHTFYSVDPVNNTSASTSTLPSTVLNGSEPIYVKGGGSAPHPENTVNYIQNSGTITTYDQSWKLENNSAVIPPSSVNIAGYRGFKSGVKHSLGIVYYDKYNRSGTVNPCGDIYVPFRNERIPAIEDSPASIHFKINHNPPDWAQHWQWVWAPHKRGDFLQITVNSIEYDVNIKARYRTVLPESQDDDAANNKTGFQSLIEPAVLSAGYVKMDMEELIRHSAKSSSDTFMWQWAPGDRVRIIDTQTVGITGPTSINYAGFDYEIIGIEEDIPDPTTSLVGKLWFILEKAAVGPVIDGGDAIDVRIELYRPVRTKGDVYYEFGHVNWCTGGFHSVNRIGTEQQLTAPGNYTTSTGASTPLTYHANQSSGVPAEGTLKVGDVYLRERLMITAGANISSPIPTGGIIIAEDYSYSDFYKSKGWDLGRVNAYLPDFKKTRREATIFFSERFIPNTNINGLGTFYPDVSFQEYDKKFNSIQKLFSLNDKLLILQEDKVSQALVSRAVLFDASGQQNVAISDNVLSLATPYSGNFGIGRNPESFVNFGFRSYFVDARRRAVLRLSQDGLTPISEHGMKNFFTDYFEEVIDRKRHLGPALKIYGAYDNKFDEYVVSIPHIVWMATDPTGNVIRNQLDGFTIGFHEPSKRWNSFYSYRAHLVTYNSVLHSFDMGDVYKHNALEDGSKNPVYNTFYNVEFESILEFPFNSFPDVTKIYQSITEDASDIWEVDALYTRNNQVTNISREEFTNGAVYTWQAGHGTKENKHNAVIRCNLLTPGVALPKIEGDRMRDTSIMCRLQLPAPLAVRQNVLFSVNCGFVTSTNPTDNKNQ